MWLFSPSARARQGELHTPRNIKDIGRTGSWAVFILACMAAATLVFSAGAQNVAYAYTLGMAKSEFAAYVLAAASLGASVLGPCAWVAVFGRRVPIGTRAVALLMAVGCLVYASTCSLGYGHGARTGAVSGWQAAHEAHADARALRDAAKAELATLKGQSPAVLERRAELMTIIAMPMPTKAAQPGVSDPQASAVGFYARAFGYRLSDADVGPWLSLGTVIFLELAAALSLTVAATLRPTRPEAPSAAVLPQPTHAPATIETAASAPEKRQSGDDKDDAPPPPAPKPRRGGRPAAVEPSQAVARLRKAGGQASGSVRDVGRLLGAKSKSAAHRLLHRMSEAGQVRLAATSQGVSVALV